jgi:hypothetical protein
MQDATRDSNEQQSKSTSLAGIFCWGRVTALLRLFFVELKWVARIAISCLPY